MSLTVDQFLDAFADINFYGVRSIQFFNAAVNEGKAYILTVTTAANGLDIATPIVVFVETPPTDELTYIDIMASLAAGGIIEMFEDDGDPLHFDVSGGTALVARNRNRNFPDASNLIIKKDSTINALTDDTKIFCIRLGSRKVGGNMAAADGVLKSGTKYVIRVSTNADNNEGTLMLNWYEAIKRT